MSEREEQLTAMLAQAQAVDAKRARVILGIVIDGLAILFNAAKAGDAGAQQELSTLSFALKTILEDNNEPTSRLSVVRRN